MHWFTFALLSPILITLANQIDKHLIEEYFRGGGIGAMMIFSSLAGILLLAPAYVFSGFDVLRLPLRDALTLVVVGILSAIAIFCYLLALEKGETSVIVPFFQSVPIFGLVLGLVFLGEKIQFLQLVAIPIIIFGSLILSYEIDSETGVRIKTKPILLILASSFLFAINAIIFKKVALVTGFWTSIFWEYMGLLFVGLILFLSVKHYRRQFIEVFKENSRRVLVLTISTEIVVLCGFLCVEFALMIGPVALVLLADCYEPIFVLTWGLIFARFFPSMSYDNFSKRHLIKKIVGITVIFTGSFLLNMATTPS